MMPVAPRNFDSNRCSPAFTLIELLTVIAIIGILASILIPTVSKVRSVAKSANCASNLRENGRMCALFANDYKGRMPSQIQSGNNLMGYWYTSATVPKSYGPDQIAYSLWPYYNRGIAKTGATTATSAPSLVRSLICPSHNPSITVESAIHYTLNLITIPQNNPGAGYNIFPYGGGVKSIGKMITMNNVSSLGLSPSKVWLMQDYDTAAGDAGKGIAGTPHHQTKRNRLYMDGSVRSLSLDESSVSKF